MVPFIASAKAKIAPGALVHLTLRSRPKPLASRRHCWERPVEEIEKNAPTASSTTTEIPRKAEKRLQQRWNIRIQNKQERSRDGSSYHRETHKRLVVERAYSSRATGSMGPARPRTDSLPPRRRQHLRAADKWYKTGRRKKRRDKEHASEKKKNQEKGIVSVGFRSRESTVATNDTHRVFPPQRVRMQPHVQQADADCADRLGPRGGRPEADGFYNILLFLFYAPSSSSKSSKSSSSPSNKDSFTSTPAAAAAPAAAPAPSFSCGSGGGNSGTRGVQDC